MLVFHQEQKWQLARGHPDGPPSPKALGAGVKDSQPENPSLAMTPLLAVLYLAA